MRITSAAFRDWRGFTNLEISAVPVTSRLVFLAGPNGVGKSSVFDGFRVWQYRQIQHFADDEYYGRSGSEPGGNLIDRVNVSLDKSQLLNNDNIRSAFYMRSAYRHEADFNVTGLQSMKSPELAVKATRMIDADQKISDNYKRILSQTVSSVFGGNRREMTVGALADELVGLVQDSMRRVFPDLVVEGLEDPLATSSGSFYFRKGNSHKWHFKNLSGGERAAFDILLDFIMMRHAFADTIYCIDEPELHLNTALQGALLRELVDLLPGESQLWVSSHSIGMMKAAWDLSREAPGSVSFLDFKNRDFTQATVMVPTEPSRRFWQDALQVAIGDLAYLTAPAYVVLVEGTPPVDSSTDRGRVAFDARCYGKIFVDRDDVEFVSVGSSGDVLKDSSGVGQGIQTVVPGVRLIRLIDRDDRSDDEITELVKEGHSVLRRRALENYLLGDEMLTILCNSVNRSDHSQLIIAERDRLLAESGEKSHNRPDDFKRIRLQLFHFIRRELQLGQAGTSVDVFLRDTISPLVDPTTETYRDLSTAIFDPTNAESST